MKRKPEVLLIDDLCSNQAAIETLLKQGCNIYTTLNVFDIESVRIRNDLPAELFTGPAIGETFLHLDYQLEFIDIEPHELIRRYENGKIYRLQQMHHSRAPLFEEKTLLRLRNIALDFISGFQDKRVLPSCEYLLVCISPAASSRRVIQAAARSAKTVNARLIALHVETRNSLRKTESTKRQLHKNLQLAEQLGAEIVNIQARSVSGGIAEYVSMRNIRRIAVGRSLNRPPIYELFKSDTVRKLFRLIPWAEIHIIPGFPGDYQQELLSNKKRSAYIQTGQKKNSGFPMSTFLKQLLLLSGASLLAILFDVLGLSEANIILVFLLGVVLISLSGERWMGIASSAISVMLFNFLFTEPRYTFIVTDPQYLVIFPLLFIVALITSELVNREKREARAADIREQRTEVLYRISRSLLKATGPRTVIMSALEHLSGIFNIGLVVYLPQNDTQQLTNYHLGPDSQKSEQFEAEQEKEAAEWCFQNAQPAGRGTPNFPIAQGKYFPIQTHNQVLGVLGVEAPHTLSDDNRNSMIEAVAAQIALALDRENLAEAQEKSRIEIERERLRSNLLRAISHDLRSPLASITGSSSTLLYDWKKLNNESRSELLQNIKEDADWLAQLIENILSLAKVEGPSFVLHKENELADDIIAGVLNKLKSQSSEHIIRVELPDEPVFVSADVGLLQQVLINLIDNALRYTPKGSSITIRAEQKKKQQQIEFRVADNGPGIPAEYQEKVFERFITLKSTDKQRRGLGLGLSICKSIVEIHQGSIRLNQSTTGGAEFVFNLPDPLTAGVCYGN
ncbi:MAG: DUF4118 domain-containing protein [Spirochaetales bacterium]|nr:DUF4118 domain-containing protein [Spirochaetales bacterium]MCF7938535.1 DUF4118 domain-containing protein [Spirochaetales bacterium]